MDVADLEALAIATYKRLGLDPAEPADPAELARRLLNDPSPIELVNWLATGNGALFRFRGKRRIAIRRRAPLEYQLFALAHELAHVIIEDAGAKDADLERNCDYLAACLIGPAPATERLHRFFGFDLARMADATASTQTWAALRLGEVMRIPLATVQPRKVRYRGPKEQLELFPDEATLREVARGKAHGGLRKVRMRDAERVAIVAA